MPTSILHTKLYTPQPQPDLVSRAHLDDKLNQGLYRKLTLISVPAGFGKTTLVSAWTACSDRPIAWLSLDEGDNDSTRFLIHLVAALRTVALNIGERVSELLQSPQPAPIESILTTLLNEINTAPGNFTLVLDDYHVIDAKPIDEALTFLLEHLPPQMHLVITTREDPSLPLARLRARGQMTELRATDLRFMSSEAAIFLNQVMGLNLSEEEIAALETRTEGWIAGLQMAALALQGLSMQGRSETATFIQAFTGSHHFILDYLVEEVLQRQPERVRSFLLQTSILDQLSGLLCDAVTGQTDSRGVLETLERSNLFVIPLDDQRQWYRYHHLFAEVLQAHTMAEQPDLIPALHQRASVWYEQNDLPAAAIRHALAAQDFARAADLIELARPGIEKGYRDMMLRGWVKALPDELVRTRPVLNVGYALALLDAGELEAAQPRLQDVEQWLETTTDLSEQQQSSSSEMVVVDEAQFRSLPASIAIARTWYSQASGDIPSTVKYAQQALDRLPEEDHLRRGQMTGFLGLAYWASGDLEAALRTLLNAEALTQKAGTILDTIAGVFVGADILVALGQLHEAVRLYEHALQLVTEHGEPMPLGIENVYSGLSELHRERNDLAAAAQDLVMSKTLGERVGERIWRCRWCLAQARLKEAVGDLDGALDLLNEVEGLYIRNPLPNVRPIAALKTRIWIRQGRLTTALGWVRERGLSVDDDLSYLREFEHITLARVYIALYKRDGVDSSICETMGLLERLLNAAEEGGRMGSVIEILVLQALAHKAQGNVASALVSLERALTLAEPEDYVRIFVDEGPPMAQLLLEAADRRIMPDYTGMLLASFEAEKQRNAGESPPPTASSTIHRAAKPT